MWDIIKYERSEKGIALYRRVPSIFYRCVCNHNGQESFFLEWAKLNGRRGGGDVGV